MLLLQTLREKLCVCLNLATCAAGGRWIKYTTSAKIPCLLHHPCQSDRPVRSWPACKQQLQKVASSDWLRIQSMDLHPGKLWRKYFCRLWLQHSPTNVRDAGCMNVGGFKTGNLCGVKIIPHGHWGFYTTGRFRPGWTKRTCNARDGRCDTQAWPAIYSYQCFFD